MDILPPNTVVQGRQAVYEVQGTVGRGGMGVVYRARRSTDGMVIALKELRAADISNINDDKEGRDLFAQEAELLLRLRHPNVVMAYEIFEWQNRAYFVMEFVAGVTLERKLRDANAPAFEQEAVSWGVQMARVLAYLHNQTPPVIYRDLKPGNVMLLPDGTIKFIDFGVARIHKAGKAKDTIAIGTYGYAPPEQYGKGQTDARSDLYTLGATMYHLLTNLGPIPLKTPDPGSLHEHNPSVRPMTEAVVIKAMQQDRLRRYQSAAEMEQALAACLPPLAPAPTPAPDATQRTAQPPIPPRAKRGVAAPPQTSPRPPAMGPTQQIAPSAPAPTTGESRFCPNCGFGNKPTARFCTACGTPLPPLQAAPAPAPAPVFQQNGRFQITTGRGAWEFPLATMPCRIGRRDPSQNHYPELDLADYDRGHASRRHAVVERRGTQFVITDVGSINGTLLNGQRLVPHRSHTLQPGDVVKIGDVQMRFEWV